jgi:hypothetical protein
MSNLKNETTLYNISIMKFKNFKRRKTYIIWLIKNTLDFLFNSCNESDYTENEEKQWLDACLDKLNDSSFKL